MNTLIGVGGVFMLFMVVMGVLLLSFWIWMFFDVIIKQPEDKFVWLLVVFFFSVPGALVYYFVARKKRITASSVAAVS